jgi:hypothetical protein
LQPTVSTVLTNFSPTCPPVHHSKTKAIKNQWVDEEEYSRNLGPYDERLPSLKPGFPRVAVP